MSDNQDWRDRLRAKKERDQEQVEGFFEGRRGQIFIWVGLALIAGFAIWKFVEQAIFQAVYLP